MAKEWTFEAVDEHVRAADQKALATRAAAISDLADICEIYKMIRPILKWIGRILPARWRAILDLFIQVMDRLCP